MMPISDINISCIDSSFLTKIVKRSVPATSYPYVLMSLFTRLGVGVGLCSLDSLLSFIAVKRFFNHSYFFDRYRGFRTWLNSRVLRVAALILLNGSSGASGE